MINLKKGVLLLLMFVSFTNVNPLQAQFLQTLGVGGGVSFASQHIYSWSLIETSYKAGVFTSVTADFLDSKYFSCNMQLGYCEKGNKILMHYPYATFENPEIEEGPLLKNITDYNYLFFSSNVKLKYTMGNLTPYVFVGPGFAYLTHKSDDIFAEMFDSMEISKQSVFIAYGIGLDCRINRFVYYVEVQNQYDISLMHEIDLYNNSNGLKNIVSVLSLGIKYCFSE